jgi:hypothetical protein
LSNVWIVRTILENRPSLGFRKPARKRYLTDTPSAATMAVVFKNVSYGLNADKLAKTTLSIELDLANKTARLLVPRLLELVPYARH